MVDELKPQSAKLFGVALPVLGDLDPQVEIDLGAQQVFDLATGRGTHLPQPGTTLADDDALLTISLDVQRGVYVDQVVTPSRGLTSSITTASEWGSSSRTP